MDTSRKQQDMSGPRSRISGPIAESARPEQDPLSGHQVAISNSRSTRRRSARKSVTVIGPDDLPAHWDGVEAF
jgi:hypothetical protein